jgi:intracellular sulfur oxidation DsrE/DsrF family protein
LRYSAIALFMMSLLAAPMADCADAPTPVPAMISGAYPYVPIPGAAAAPDKSRIYKVIFNVTKASAKPEEPVEGVLFAATDLSALRGQSVPTSNTKFALIFHGPAVDGLLDNASYQAKFGVSNPNLAMLSALKRAGAEVLVCSQFIGAMKIDPAKLTPDAALASEAFITLITYQNNGYAVLEF